MSSEVNVAKPKYRGRLAPSPTGYLHLGHARTFWTAQLRAREHDGTLILRDDDLDRDRCRPEFVSGMFEDLKWFGFEWTEGPDIGGSHAPYNQSQRMEFYRAALKKLRAGNFIYPCYCSRKDIQAAVTAPHAADDELIYPGTCRDKDSVSGTTSRFSWRFRVCDGEVISFTDGRLGEQRVIAGKDFGDFVIWRHDDVPAYQLACVVDDAAMQITEVVRGEDLLVSTARQILLYRALGWMPPAFFHCGLVRDEQGERLAKRHDALALQTLRKSGISAQQIRSSWSDGKQCLTGRYFFKKGL